MYIASLCRICQYCPHDGIEHRLPHDIQCVAAANVADGDAERDFCLHRGGKACWWWGGGGEGEGGEEEGGGGGDGAGEQDRQGWQ